MLALMGACCDCCKPVKNFAVTYQLGFENVMPHLNPGTFYAKFNFTIHIGLFSLRCSIYDVYDVVSSTGKKEDIKILKKSRSFSPISGGFPPFATPYTEPFTFSFSTFRQYYDFFKFAVNNFLPPDAQNFSPLSGIYLSNLSFNDLLARIEADGEKYIDILDNALFLKEFKLFDFSAEYMFNTSYDDFKTWELPKYAAL